jgi:hypothetical protein
MDPCLSPGEWTSPMSSNDPYVPGPETFAGFPSGGPPHGTPGIPPLGSHPCPAPPPAGSPGTRLWLWILGFVGFVVLSPLCCCGGLLVYASSFKEFTIRNGEHLGGGPMNVRFEYELREVKPVLDPYFIVVRAADGTVRERPLQGWVEKRGVFHFSAFDVPPQEGLFPVRVWLEREGRRGERMTASNTLLIYGKK